MSMLYILSGFYPLTNSYLKHYNSRFFHQHFLTIKQKIDHAIYLSSLSSLSPSFYPFLILSALFYKASGKFSDFWFCTVQYASEYVSLTSLAEGFENFKYNFARILESNFTILWLSLIGLVSVAWVRDKNQEYLFLFGFFLM